MNTIEKINSFDNQEWSFERSSGYPGFRHRITNEWIYQNEARQREIVKQDFERDLKLLHDFRRDSLPFGEYPDYVLLEFLEKKYKERVENIYSAGNHYSS